MYNTLTGGFINRIVNSYDGFIGGGSWNQMFYGPFSTISGGQRNLIFEKASTVAGGRDNHIQGEYGTIGGGCGEAASPAVALRASSPPISPCQTVSGPETREPTSVAHSR